MSISYEEALATLEAMFGAPWTRESLDLVLRHEKGHMENTCDRILNYGSERNPQGLLEQLQSGQGGASASGGDQQVNMDEEIARQLAAQQGGSGATSGGAASSSTAPTASTQQHKGRGTPTVLPKDFLRIPGYPHRSVLAERAGSGSASRSGGAGPGMNGGGAQMDDEALARMLQDEFFSQELARNPEFAHLAGGRVPHRTGRSGATVPPGQRRSTANARQQQQQPQGPNIIDKLSEMGDTARKRLSMFATQFENSLNQTRQNLQKSRPGGGMHNTTPGMGGGAGMSAAERRGLLDGGGSHDEEEIEFEVRKNQ